MPVIGVPYHLDEYLPEPAFPLAAGETVGVAFPPGDVWARLAVLYAAVARSVARAAGTGDGPVVMSGDCTTAMGTVAGLQQAGLDPGIVWFDAHGDVQTLETSASGYLGGVPLRMLAGYRPELITARLGLRAVPEPRIVLVGARDLDPPEVAYLAGAGLRRSEVADLTLADLPGGPLYVHVDLDVVDASGIGALRYPVPGGPGLAQVTGKLRMLLATGRVAAVGLACTWYPGPSAGPHDRHLLNALFTAPD